MTLVILVCFCPFTDHILYLPPVSHVIAYQIVLVTFGFLDLGDRKHTVRFYFGDKVTLVPLMQQ